MVNEKTLVGPRKPLYLKQIW